MSTTINNDPDVTIAEELTADYLVVGGGLAGICAAIQASRLGVEVILAEKSCVLGGNSGPDGGVHPSGAHRFHTYAAETGIIEEIIERAAWRNAKTQSADLHYNVSPLWDNVLYEMLTEAGVKVLRNHYARKPVTNDNVIRAVILENTSAYKTITVFVRHGVIDASGDGNISVLAGAEFRMGRESKYEYSERSAPEKSDKITMGSSVVALIRKSDKKVDFIPPDGAPPYFPGYSSYPAFRPGPQEDLFFFFPAETGGQLNTIEDEQEAYLTARKLLFSTWNYIKNEKYIKEARNWELLWIGPKLLKRESRRFRGDYTLTQCDVESGRVFDDAIAYGGFAEDIHYPREAMPEYVKITYIGIPPIYTIPFRCVYSVNIKNLFFASRLLSVSHIAHGTVRVQRTLSSIGQAVGCAAALTKKYGLFPREIGKDHINELRQLILSEDGSIPGATNEDDKDLAKSAHVKASSERIQGNEKPDRWISLGKPMGAMLWDHPKRIDTISFLLDNKSSKSVKISASLKVRSYPQKWKFNEVGTMQKGFMYEKGVNECEWADKNDHDIFSEIKTVLTELPTGVNWLEIPLNEDMLTKHDTIDEERYLVLLLATDDVKMAVNDRFSDYCRRAEKGADEYLTYGDTPVFKITPELPYGEARNIIDGINRRFSNNPIHMWKSSANGKEPQIIELNWDNPIKFSKVHITFDTLERTYREMPFDCNKRVSQKLTRDYRIDVFRNDKWESLCDVSDNYNRFRKHKLSEVEADRVRIVIKRVWDEESSPGIYEVRVY